jgi:hypothetical protein
MIIWKKVPMWLRRLIQWLFMMAIITAVIVALVTNWEKVQLGSLAQWLSAVGTITAVLYALFKEQLLSRWRQPKLTVIARQHPPDIDYIPFSYPTTLAPPGYPTVYASTGGYCLRLWIHNDGDTRAEKVQVFVSKVLRDRAGDFIPVESFIPMNLRWGFGSETPTHAEVFADGISPGMGVHCNLAQVLDPSNRKAAGDDHPRANPEETVIRLTTEMNPNNGCNVFAKGTYKLTLLIAGSNCRPKEYTLQITLDGRWFGEREKMLQDGVIMKIIEGPVAPRKEEAGR